MNEYKCVNSEPFSLVVFLIVGALTGCNNTLAYVILYMINTFINLNQYLIDDC